MRTLLLAILCSLAVPALAQPELSGLPEVKLERVPPTYSYDFGLQFGVTEVTWWREDIPAWGKLGLFGAWGRHLNNGDRLGFGLALTGEGDVPIHMTLAIEPTLRWDRVQGKLALGFSTGAALMYHRADKVGGIESATSAAPLVAARIGWSEGFTRVGRRLFVVLEPKVRYMVGRFSPSLSIAVGTGHGY